MKKLTIENKPEVTGTPDPQILRRIFTALNIKYFNEQITATVKWGVPEGSVTVDRGNTPGFEPAPGTGEFIALESAKAALKRKHNSSALFWLLPLAEAGHKESLLLACHLLKRQGKDWQKYAQAYNQTLRSVRSIAAACYYPEKKLSVIHPHLFKRSTPYFVLRYLIYHECCHQLLNSSGNNPHPPEFMAWEKKAPNRDRANSWLERNHFPVIQNDITLVSGQEK